jgi:hypothetical protein
MPLVALFGISNDGLNLAVNLLVVFLVIVYLALIVWTYLDASRRIQDQWLVACATAASLFPFVGAMVYAILRPPEFLEDRREREIDTRAAELRLRQLSEASCPNCEHPVERTYLRCPHCEVRLKDPCPSCAKPIDPRWAICPYCEVPIQRREPEQRRERSQRRQRTDREPPSRAAREAARDQARAARDSAPKRSAKRSKVRVPGTARKAPARAAAPPKRQSAAEPRPAATESQPTAERAAAPSSTSAPPPKRTDS